MYIQCVNTKLCLFKSKYSCMLTSFVFFKALYFEFSSENLNINELNIKVHLTDSINNQNIVMEHIPFANFDK